MSLSRFRHFAAAAVIAAAISLIPTTHARSADPQRRSDPQTLRQIAGPLPGGAALQFDMGDANATYTIAHVVPPSLGGKKIKWDVSRVRGANGVLLEVARAPFGLDKSPDSRPRAIVSIERIEGTRGATTVSVGQIATDAGYVPPPERTGPVRTEGIDRRASFLANGGHFTIYIRVVPIASVSDPRPVGLASGSLQIVYAKSPPNSLRFNITNTSSAPTKPSPIEIVSVKYVPVKEYCFVHPSKTVCNQVGEEKPWYEKVVSFVTEAWNWAAEKYQEAKKAVVDLASSLLPFVPREAFETALDGALAACGMPPNIPNLDQLMEQGADYLAGEVAAQIGPPVANDIAKQHIKSGILAGAKAAKKKLGNAGSDTACQYTIEWAYAIVLIRNKTNETLNGVSVSAFDWTGVWATNDWDGRLFNPYAQGVSTLKPGAPLPVFMALMPNMLQKKHYPGGVHKELVYWTDYNTMQTNLTVTAWTGDFDTKNTTVTTGSRKFNVAFEVKY